MLASACSVGNVRVETTSNRGFTPEEIAERALGRLMYVGENSPPVIREQALAFKDDIRKVLVFYMHEVVKSHNITLQNRFREAGHLELTYLLEE